MPQSAEQFTKWVRRSHPAPQAKTRLVCLPHAGGSASFYFPVSRALAPAVEVLAVQYPGRQDRRHEPNIPDLHAMADRILDAVRTLDDKPVALFGHSMGAVLAYEVALRMQDAGLPAPVRVFTSGRRAPSCLRDERIHAESDEQLVAELRKLSGTADTMLTDPELLEMIMPAIRSDYRAVETYAHDPGRKLDCPVTVLTGDSDPRVTVEEAAAWEHHTSGPTDLHVYPGGHFYLAEPRESALVIALLRELLAAPGAEDPALARAAVA